MPKGIISPLPKGKYFTKNPLVILIRECGEVWQQGFGVFVGRGLAPAVFYFHPC